MLFITPALLMYALFTAYPVFRTLWNSLHTIKPGNVETFVGLANYAQLFTGDPVFYQAVTNTMIWAFVAPFLDVLLGLLLALVLYGGVRGARFFRVAWFTPVLISYVVVGIMWMWIYNYDWGALNGFCVPWGWAISPTRGSAHPKPPSLHHRHSCLEMDRFQHGRVPGRLARAVRAKCWRRPTSTTAAGGPRSPT